MEKDPAVVRERLNLQKNDLYEICLLSPHLCTWSVASTPGLGAGQNPTSQDAAEEHRGVCRLCLQSAAKGSAVSGTGGAEDDGV